MLRAFPHSITWFVFWHLLYDSAFDCFVDEIKIILTSQFVFRIKKQQRVQKMAENDDKSKIHLKYSSETSNISKKKLIIFPYSDYASHRCIMVEACACYLKTYGLPINALSMTPDLAIVFADHLKEAGLHWAIGSISRYSRFLKSVLEEECKLFVYTFCFFHKLMAVFFSARYRRRCDQWCHRLPVQFSVDGYPTSQRTITTEIECDSTGWIQKRRWTKINATDTG